jgi:hypothetical protein
MAAGEREARLAIEIDAARRRRVERSLPKPACD